ncbi:hypothetical protein M440DRAFT_195356 [Trichoderma longibrachiatum ATCC 18648]|uniref:Uncharacterized protein n=1 Tax=Trichoderma longibrachiatum ATCC 18648 TaxID=983965 RepID=A0A2T4CFX1_TRILO|nr:hypothetical protein M440DRAFT_195356 [Trichoderma longibrachiatum ATCC 18648]
MPGLSFFPLLAQGSLLCFSGEIEHQPQDRGIADFVSRYDDVRIRLGVAELRQIEARPRHGKRGGKREEGKAKKREKRKGPGGVLRCNYCPPLGSASGRYGVQSNAARKSAYDW